MPSLGAYFLSLAIFFPGSGDVANVFLRGLPDHPS
jgi:hypothetical protein